MCVCVCVCVVCVCVCFQARNKQNGEFAAIKIIKMEPGKSLDLSSDQCNHDELLSLRLSFRG